ncbi:hypothetical protein D9611_006326 [Ephemerocybe angulata]|uniref:DUF1753-domain-containing protein n=1 Tax=Ephemerocybe angulata TaxID=980116 RepID=A0A8H5FG50_9AGAR|nr:hypothetical protein D9611_006326 [Tulosesus angulatus]
MKLMLKPGLRLWPLSSFLGLIDIKTGVTVALLFAVLNKVAGVYGLIAVLTGAGGSFAQLSLYIYSVIALLALVWGLRAVKNEDSKQTLYFAHLFFADHIFSTAWTVFFALAWWLWTAHDGERQANSDAQQALIKLANITHVYTPEERKEAALEIWHHEKGKAAAIIIISWLAKIYFILIVYSYATHLRKGSYRSLPLTRSAHSAASSTQATNAYESLADGADDEEIEDFYRVPLQTPVPPVNGHRRGGSHNSSFADFVSAPGRTARKKGNASVSGGIGGTRDRRIDEEVLFDEEEQTAYAASTSSRAHSKFGTDSTAVSDEERNIGMGGESTMKGKRI